MQRQPVLMLEACSNSQHEILAQMIQDGCDVNFVWPGHLRLLHVASSRGDIGSVRLLLSGGACVDETTAKGETAMHLACAQGHRLVVDALHKTRGDINLGDHRGNTPLHAAMAARHFDCARQLLWYGATTHQRNVHRLRAEDMAPVLLQPGELVDLFRVMKIRSRKAQAQALTQE